MTSDQPLGPVALVVLLAAALREKGPARAAQFTWQRTARETIAVYERVLAGNDE